MARPLKYPFPQIVGEVSKFTVPFADIGDVLLKLASYKKRNGRDFALISSQNEAGDHEITMTRTL